MQTVRLQNDPLSRILHNSVHQRLLNFCNQYTPEVPGEPVVSAWMLRMWQGDQNLHILVTIDDNYKITGHCVLDVQDVYGYKVVYCHQALADKGNTSTLEEGIQYLQDLCKVVEARCSVFTVTKHLKGLEKRYGYKVTRTVMMKLHGEADE